VEIRTLRPEEREALLGLLDAWDVGDGWRGRDFFRRYLEDDPTFREENVLVAIDAGEPISCVQIFPRRLRMRGRAIPMGGIGSVFTRDDQRRRGIGERVMHAAMDAMRSRGLLVGLLFAGPVKWYERLGWSAWPVRRQVLRRDAPPGAEGEPFDATRDLEGVRALHAAMLETLEGAVVRDDALWSASLRNAGNPDEDFAVSRAGGGVSAYTRTTRLGGLRVLLEAGGDIAALAPLLAAQVEGHLVTCDLAFLPGLESALVARGVSVQSTTDPTGMMICLDAPALCNELGVQPDAGKTPNELLRSWLPPERFHFWTADRF
jgi:predicted N-acetyltransferase YhbS